MVHEELSARLNEVGYKNWLKAGYCLLKVKNGLCAFADSEMKHFHNAVMNSNSLLQRRQVCRSYCKPKGNQLHSTCHICSEWIKEIVKHHTNPSFVINWGNCKPWMWTTEHWELAKAFMPKGQADKTRAEQCDAAALLNLLNFCDHFSSINQSLIRAVIHCRNELMHSCEMQVSDQWMNGFQKSLEQLLLQLRHIPEAADAGRQIQEMLSVDLSVHVPGVDQVDGVDLELKRLESISQWEAELLRESLKDLLNNAEDKDKLIPEEMDKLQKLQMFLQDHKDLEEQFRTELQSIHTLEAKYKCGSEGLKR